jgi:hypothetical protein
MTGTTVGAVLAVLAWAGAVLALGPLGMAVLFGVGFGSQPGGSRVDLTCGLTALVGILAVPTAPVLSTLWWDLDAGLPPTGQAAVLGGVALLSAMAGILATLALGIVLSAAETRRVNRMFR